MSRSVYERKIHADAHHFVTLYAVKDSRSCQGRGEESRGEGRGREERKTEKGSVPGSFSQILAPGCNQDHTYCLSLGFW